MRAQRHICQANHYDVIQPSHGMFMPVFVDEAADKCFHHHRAIVDRIGAGVRREEKALRSQETTAPRSPRGSPGQEKRMSSGAPWTAREDSRLRKLYPAASKQELDASFSRSPKAIRSRARVLRLHKAIGHGGRYPFSKRDDKSSPPNLSVSRDQRNRRNSTCRFASKAIRESGTGMKKASRKFGSHRRKSRRREWGIARRRYE